MSTVRLQGMEGPSSFTNVYFKVRFTQEDLPLCLVMYLTKGGKCHMKTIMVGRTPLGTSVVPTHIFTRSAFLKVFFFFKFLVQKLCKISPKIKNLVSFTLKNDNFPIVRLKKQQNLSEKIHY